jgi:integrase
LRKPYWRAQSQTWVVKPPGGRLKTLGNDPHGATRKHPPKEIQEAWHNLDREADPRPKDMLFSEVADEYLAYLTNPKSNQVARASGMVQGICREADEGLRPAGASRQHLPEDEGLVGIDEGHRRQPHHLGPESRRCRGVYRGPKVKYARGKKPKYGRRETIPTEAQQRKLEDAAHPELKAILAGLRESGCRPSELCGVTINKVKLKQRVMTVQNKTARTTGKKERDVYMSRTLVDLVRDTIGSRTEGPVFLNAKGRPWRPDIIGNAVYRIRKELGLPEHAVAYSIRHGYISAAVNDTDANVALITRQVGHANLNMMMRNYLHESPDAMRRTVDKIANREKKTSEEEG